MTAESVLTFVLALFAAGTVLLGIAAAWRAAAMRRRERALGAQVGSLRLMLEQHAASGFQDVERLFVELRAADDPQQLDAALREAGGEFEALDPETCERLRSLYRRLGLLQHHQWVLREASDWRSRADSALLLGHLGVVEAIPALAAAVRDPDEDGSTVKAAAARALGMMSEPGTAEALVTELAEPGDWSAPRIAEVLVELGEKSLAPCLAGLESENANVRAWCSRVLGQLGELSAVQPLGRRLLDRSGAVRTVAAEALGLLGDSRATPSLVEAMLRDPAAQVRASAARALGRTGDPASLSALVDALNDADPWTRIRAVEALEAVHPEEPELLLQAVRSGREESARAAALALERTGHVQHWVEQLDEGPAGGVAALEEQLISVACLGGSGPLRRTMTSSPDLRLRARAANLLGRSADPDALEDIERACSDLEWPVRLEAVRAWVKTASEGTLPTPLLNSLDDSEEMVRVAALEGLALRGDVGKVDPERLPQLAGQANLEARTAALELVKGTGLEVERTVALLLRHDPSDALRAAATGVLGTLCTDSDDPIFASLLDALVDTAEDVRAAGAHALGRLPEGLGSQALVHATFDAGPKLREEITSVLATRGLDGLHDELDMFMASDREEARLAVLWTLGKVGDPRGVPLLVAALDDHRARVRSSAVGALAKMDAEHVIPPLRFALKDPDARTRAAVTNALGRIAGPVIEPLRKVLDDPDAFVRGRAYVALGRVGDNHSRLRMERAIQGSDPIPALIGLSLLGGDKSAAMMGHVLHGPLLSRLEGALEKEDEEVGSRVRSFLGIAEPGIARTTWISGLRRSLESSRDASERLRALELLASFDLQELLGRLGPVASADPDPRLRVRAVRLLAANSAPGDPALLSGLRDPDDLVRLAALRAGARLGPSMGGAVLACANGTKVLDRATVQTLVKLFEEDPFALADLLMGASLEAERAVAIRALGELSSPHVVPLLTALLDDDSTQIRVEAVRALEALQHAGADAAMTGIEAAAKDPNSDVRGAALAALVRFDDGRDSELEEALKGEPDPEVRTAIVGALAVRSDETALDLMTSSMTDPHPGVRRAAMLAALSTPHSLGLDTFLKVLENADQVEAQSLRTEALKAGVVAGLRRALRDGPLPLRVSSVRVLASLDASRFEESLLSAVGDPAPPVRSAALDALVLCDSESAWTAVIRAARDEDNWVATRARAAVAGAK